MASLLPNSREYNVAAANEEHMGMCLEAARVTLPLRLAWKPPKAPFRHLHVHVDQLQ
ncbi:hypothetical protein FH972_022432 [Carpinus fangiana]|uniref:Uncharacterized protein n=1 Tax=Carpinus fangiana TaxID=176857 RepID=A0A5N6KS81_9ROSI|nr:hypothetical protein FH972_022432 [Carpinus fangiana]